MESRRPNECPRCGFVYTAWNKPKPANSSFSQRFLSNLRERRRYGFGALGDARHAQAEQTRPWQCRCGTWLRSRPWTFGWVDVAGIVVLAVAYMLLAARYAWARNQYVFALPIGLWVLYRTASQVAVEEVPVGAAEK